MRRLVLACLLTGCYVPLTSFTDTVDAGLPACPAEYLQIPGAPPDNPYRFDPSNRAWDVNEDDCEDDSTVGTHLVIIDDDAERLAVVEYLQGMTGGFIVHAGYARNLTDNPTTGFFKVTGEPCPVTRPPWGDNQPDNSGGAESITWFSLDTGIHDDSVLFTAQAMCECDRKPATKSFVLR